jgi:cytochrome c oxidase cbb3-type subunit III
VSRIRACALAALALLPACGGRETPPQPAAGWLAEPLAAVRTSGLAAGPSDSLPPVKNPYEGEPGALAQGRQLYQAFNCAGCHGGEGGGGIGPPLADDDWIYGGSAANIYATIVQGRPNGMPAFGPSLQGEAVWKLAAYVQSFGGESEQEKAPPGGQAPEREGQVEGQGR